MGSMHSYWSGHKWMCEELNKRWYFKSNISTDNQYDSNDNNNNDQTIITLRHTENYLLKNAYLITHTHNGIANNHYKNIN